MQKFVRFAASFLSLIALPLFAAELRIGDHAPAFALVNPADASTVAMNPIDGHVKVVVFTSRDCAASQDFVPRLTELANRYGHRGVEFFAIDTHAAADPDAVYPTLADPDRSAAYAYGATVTPEAFVIDGAGVVRYHGYIDETSNAADRKASPVLAALNALLAGREAAGVETKAYGCGLR
ncbi:MAG: redoxin domain-containing protein [Acidobacteriota bacterium]|nr:redoxin domain-containing protein [Acidobacteriota bacterium]